VKEPLLYTIPTTFAAAFSDISSVETREVNGVATALVGVGLLLGLLVFAFSREYEGVSIGSAN
jgi:hypothetical protein